MGKVSMRCSGYFTHNGRVDRRHFQFLPAAALAGFFAAACTSSLFSGGPVDVVELSAQDAQVAMTAGTLTSRTLTRSYLDASRDRRWRAMLNSVIEINPDAMEQAD